jgi:FKBP-type peptidyl-prolyl cis-trans isomerase FklB
MKLRWLAGLSFVIAFCAVQIGAQEIPSVKDQKDKVSYSIGMEIGRNLKKQSFDLNPDLLLKGFKDAFAGEKPLMTDQEMIEVLTAFQKEVIAKQQEMAKKLGDKNKQEGETFLAENKKKEGVTTLPSGLQYKVIKAGSGKKPKATDMVTVNYRGTLLDGTEFDSSYRRGQPASFPVNGVIPGWTEALQLMEEGAKWQVFIPSNLAYGERSAGPQIGPNATLTFEIELISIQEPK